MLNQKIKNILEISVVIIFFILFSYIIQTNLNLIKSLMTNNFLGMIIYVIISIIAIVIAPVSALPLMPVASNLWNPPIAAILSIIGWTIGSLIAFIISRKYGINLIKRFIPLNKIYKLEKIIPKENIFWSVVFLRITIPVDILSYALGLFSKMKTREYLLATIIGITPFAFIFAYLGKMPFQYQILALILALITILIGIISRKNKSQTL
ncbi:VTT domain-containing protein [archaeon]|jgi:uncharacterized membrane protein YdjX (TVP38/TMEM64 family)|nr:VTT domain-containing protein [archaeon]